MPQSMRCFACNFVTTLPPITWRLGNSFFIHLTISCWKWLSPWLLSTTMASHLLDHLHGDLVRRRVLDGQVRHHSLLRNRRRAEEGARGRRVGGRGGGPEELGRALAVVGADVSRHLIGLGLHVPFIDGANFDVALLLVRLRRINREAVRLAERAVRVAAVRVVARTGVLAHRDRLDQRPLLALAA